MAPQAEAPPGFFRKAGLAGSTYGDQPVPFGGGGSPGEALPDVPPGFRPPSGPPTSSAAPSAALVSLLQVGATLAGACRSLIGMSLGLVACSPAL